MPILLPIRYIIIIQFNNFICIIIHRYIIYMVCKAYNASQMSVDYLYIIYVIYAGQSTDAHAK